MPDSSRMRISEAVKSPVSVDEDKVGEVDIVAASTVLGSSLGKCRNGLGFRDDITERRKEEAGKRYREGKNRKKEAEAAFKGKEFVSL